MIGKLLDALARWVGRGIDWRCFAVASDGSQVKHFIAQMHTNPHFQAMMRDLAQQ